MRKIILMPIILLSFVTYSAAQLKVMHSGRVSMENNLSVVPDTVSDTVPAIKIASTALFEKSAYGIYSKVWYQKNPAGPHFSFGNRAIAVYGSSEDNLIPLNHTSTPPFNAGVAGTSDKGVGVYGAIKDTFPIFNPGSYAGYFMGNTKVIGTLTCTSFTQTSDACTKHDITYLNDNTIGSIMQLKPLSFYYNTDDKLFNAANVESPAAKQMHYGFIAQELQEVLPDIVYMGQDSILGINYIELIPLLVQTVQEQQKQILELEQRIATNEVLHEDTHASLKVAPDKKSNNTATEYILYQNTPNPFNQDTKIVFLIPESTRKATLYIYNMNGLQVAEYPIHSMGEGSIVITAGHLDAGMYLYSLIADGQVIDTKRMILTK